MRNRFLLFCLVLSGFAGLAYELLWVRLLALSFGSTTLSFSTVLAVFFGGLAVGAYWAGRRAHKITKPARFYALIELGTGGLGLVLYPVLINLGDVFAQIDPGVGLTGALVRFLVATPILLAPTFLMGATLPVVTKAMIAKDDEVGHGTALIYGCNTLGAFLGTYIVTYHLLPSVGILQSILVTVAVNVVVGALAWFLSDDTPPASESESTPSEAAQVSAQTPEEHRKLVIVATGLTFFGGFAAIAFQVVWVRLFSTFLEGTVYGVGSVLISVLVGIALGSLVISRSLRHSRYPGLWFVAMQAVTLFWLLALVESFPWLSYHLGSLSAEKNPSLWPVHAQLLSVFVSIFLPTFCSGASFPLLIAIVESKADQSSRTVGSMYAANTVGSILGSVVTGFFLIPYSGSEATVLIGMVLTAVVGAVGAVFLITGIQRPLRLVLAGGVMAAVAFYSGFDIRPLSITAGRMSGYAQQRQIRSRAVNDLIFFSEGKAATVSVFRSSGSYSLTLNGLAQGGRQERPPEHLFESVLVGIVPLSHIEAPKQALVVGLGAGVTVDVLSKMDVEKITVMEIEPKVVPAVRAIFPPGAAPLDSPKVEVEIQDARHALLIQKQKNERRYDLITSMPAHPWVASGIFTQEFFELAHANLTDRGVFCSWFGTTKMDGPAVEALFRAFTGVFDHYLIYWVPEAGAYFLVGGRGPLTLDPDRIESLYAHPLLAERPELKTDGIYFLPLRIYASSDGSAGPPPEGIVNTDDSAFVEMHAPRSSTVSYILKDFLPEERFLPTMVPETHRAPFVLELIERYLGTANGRLSVVPRRPRPSRAKELFEQTKDLLDAPTQAYIEGRLALAKSRPDEARPRLTTALKTATATIAGRARRFLALSRPQGPERTAELAALPPWTDVLLERLETDLEGTLATLKGSGPAPQIDPLGAWLYRTAQPEPALTAKERAYFAQRVGPILRRTHRLALLELCIRFSTTHRLGAQAAACTRWKADREGREAGRLFNLGRRAGARGQFKEAVRFLLEANRLRPAHPETEELLIRALVEAADRSQLAELTESLAFQGRSPRYIQYLLKQAQTGKLGDDAFKGSMGLEDDDPSAAP